eukprot:CAMPEP_0181362824 /NCGR_PEP_ID=MMETSP1106-20121128/8293_1 /TAXON_ID=81844 /ORGANISM="Mantoniella antarctica, Strain SL-175" /LENGTH=296 /DNA_ID=CAMNT_0023476965 /DNA_START=168 /DNA_END=1058 /DNA_ORIENTATION=+
MPNLVHHVHGKKRVRVARTWREGDVHHFVEWMVQVSIESDMEHAYKTASNKGMTTTDTTKNQCYVVAKKMAHRCSPEEYVMTLGQQFLDCYPLISAVEVSLEEKPWTRTSVKGQPHDHGYSMQGPCTRTAQAVVRRGAAAQVTSGMLEFKVLKTTQSGYEGFFTDKHTSLKETKERILATSLNVQWTYGVGPVACYNKCYDQVTETLKELFFGPPKGGVYSPSVQYTLYQMGTAVVERVAEVQQVTMNAPNIHFIPMNVPGMPPFNDDIYVATSEPHGDITATVSKDQIFQAVSKL